MDAASRTGVDPPLPPLPDAYLAGPRGKSWFLWKMLLLGVGLGIAVKTLGPWWLGALFEAVKLESWIGLSALLIAVAAAIAVHEFGHLLAALFLDFEILGCALGPLRVSRAHGKWRLQLRIKALFSGSVTAIPRNRDFWRKRMVVVVAAGPGATLISGICGACVLLSIPAGPWMTTFLSAFAQVNFLLFFLGLIPNGSRAPVRNDARLFLSLLRNTPEAQEILLYHLVAQLEVAGLRPRDYPERLIRTLADTGGRPDMCLVYAHIILLWAIDRGDLVTADAWEQRTMDLSDFCNLRLQNLTLASSACFDLVFRGNMAAAKSKFAQVEFEMIAPAYLMHRLKAAERIAAGHIPDGLAEICTAQYCAPKQLPYCEFERSLLRELHRKAITMPPQEPVPA